MDGALGIDSIHAASRDVWDPYIPFLSERASRLLGLNELGTPLKRTGPKTPFLAYPS